VAAEDRYTVLGELARGGFGQVLEATDESLGRQVAIKQVILPGREALARFEREAKLTARLQHAGVVPVYDLGRWPDGKPFFVMKKVDGRSLDDLIGLARSLEERLALLPRVLAAADTVAYAHSRGVIHRDLKPSNVVVSDFGETVVIDWGLAKVLDGGDASHEDLPGAGPDPAFAEAGRVLGTLPFMPPEQACGGALDERADVYALGALLYNVLAGEHPYAGEPTASLLARVRQSLPRPLRELVPHVPEDLVAIVDKAMARAPGERYANAGDLAEDLRRYLDGQLVRAHHYPPSALLARWLRRHRAAVTVAVVLFAAAALAGALAVRRILAERNQAVLARRAVESRENALTLLHAERNLPHEPTAVLAWLKRYRPTPEQAWRAAAVADEAVALGVARHVLEFARPTPAVALSARAPLLATGASDGGLHLHDLRSGHRRALERHPGAVTDVAFSPADGGLASGDALGNLRLSSGAGHPLRRLALGSAPVSFLAFSADGAQLAAAVGRQEIVLVGPREPGPLQRFPMPAQLNSLTFCGGTGALVALDRDGRVQVLDRGAAAFRPLPGRHTHGRLICLPGGRQLITGGYDGVVRLWDVAGGAGRVLARHEDWVTSIAASPDGSLVATGSGDDTIRIVPRAGGAGLILRGHRDMIRGLLFSADGRRLASVGFDSTVRVWDVGSGEVLRENRAPRPGATRLLLTADGKHLVASSSREARVWPFEAPASVTLRGHDGPVTFLAWSPDGQALASVSRDRTVRTWDAARGTPRWTSARFESWTMFIRFMGPDRLLVTTRLGRNQLIDLRSGEGRELTPPGGMWASPPTGPDRLAYAEDGRATIANLATGARVPLERGPPSIKALIFSADGRQVLAASDDGVLGRWSTDDGRSLRRHQLPEPIYGLALSPDQRLVAVVTANSRLLLWDLASDRLRELPTDQVRADNLSFSADSRTLIYKAWDSTIRLVDLATRATRTLRGHRTRISLLVSAQAGPFHLASGDAYGFVRLWNLQSGATAVLHAHPGAVDTIAFSPDGRSLATSGEDAIVRVWPLEGLPTSRSPDRDPAWLGAHTSARIHQPDDPPAP
jgi:eukaryotic-like serine/threonine-protein kinase